MKLGADEPLAIEVTAVIQRGAVDELRRLLAAHAELATCRIVATQGSERSLLHIATDWPGHFPQVAEVIAVLVEAGAEVDAPLFGIHAETALHWAASADDVPAIEALLAAGASLDALGAVIGGGTPLDDAIAFGQWNAARRLVQRGARTLLWNAAALGLLDRVEAAFAREPYPTPPEVTNAFWSACHGGQRRAAEYLLDRGADIDWIGYEGLTALDAALRQGADDLVAWLRDDRGASTGAQLHESK